MARERGKESIGTVAFGVGLGLAGVFFSLALVSRVLGAASIPIWVVTIFGATGMMYSPLGKAIAARVHQKDTAPETSELADQLYTELDDMRARVAELEERVDFSERVMSGRDVPAPSHLPPQ
ncbi:MAG TPA: hypothetical protein VGM77_08120 [Gemmatimonadales bacterium]|jgi:hypothetical protein